MIERSGATAFDYQLHGGDGLTRIQWYFLDRSRLPVAVQLWELPPGGTEGGHAHPAEEPLEELYVVVEGRAAMRLEGETYELGPGDALLAPVGSEHDLRNIGDTSLKLLIVWGKPSSVDWSGYGTAVAARAAKSP